MTAKKLKNAPLIEAIFELRWELSKKPDGRQFDPHHKILLGIIYEKVKDDYPFHEQLPSADVPEGFANYIVQHRFRTDKDGWPLIQLGPGIITLNDTGRYSWTDFKERIEKVLKVLFDADPKFIEIIPDRLILRYVNAIEFDFGKNKVLDFLKKEMKLNFNIDNKLFKATNVDDQPSSFNLISSFPSLQPKGEIQLKFSRGKKKNGEVKDALGWDMIVQSTGVDVPKDESGILKWIDSAHDLVECWFFGIVDGDLRKSFDK